MYIYNITTNVTDEVHDKWLTWMRKTQIPAMFATGKFTKAKLVKVLVKEEMGGVTYSTQYTCESAEKLKDFYRNHAPQLNRKMQELFNDQIVIFGTELKVIEEFTTK